MQSKYLLFAQAFISSAGVLLLKLGNPKAFLNDTDLTSRNFLVLLSGGILYLASFLLWIYILGNQNLSYAYPMSVALTLLFTTMWAKIFLSEIISLENFFGLLLLLVAVFLVSKSN